MSDKTILSLDSISHQFQSSGFSLGPISMKIQPGDCIGLMGQNGAGKSTLFQIITGNLKPKEGTVTILGDQMTLESYQLKQKIGYLPQNLELPKWVTANEVLSYAADLYQLNNRENILTETLEKWDCTSFSSKPLAACSHGMKKRVALGLATIHDPDLLILDEPFSGLDLFHIKALQDTITHRKNHGKATILCTHIAPYTAKLCESAFTLSSGQMGTVDTWQQESYLERVETIEAIFFQG